MFCQKILYCCGGGVSGWPPSHTSDTKKDCNLNLYWCFSFNLYFCFVFALVYIFVFVFVFLFGGWCSQVLLEPPSVTGGSEHIETVQTAATASKVPTFKRV